MIMPLGTNTPRVFRLMVVEAIMIMDVMHAVLVNIGERLIMRITIGLAMSVGTVLPANTLPRLQLHVQVVHLVKQIGVVEVVLVLVLLAVVGRY